MASDVPLHIVERIIMVFIQQDANKFKYYIMEFDDSGNCDVKFGRIGANPQVHRYTNYEGRKKKQEKLRKGYKEIDAETYRAGFSQYGNLQA